MNFQIKHTFCGLILAAGIGSRLRPLTDTTPKALIKVGGITLLERCIRRMADAGIRMIVINVHHHAQQIKDFLKENDNFGLDIFVSDESDRLLDTGGGMLKAFSSFDCKLYVIVQNVDIITDIPYQKLMSKLIDDGYDVVMAVNNRKTTRYLLTDDDGEMVGWVNTQTGEILPTDLDVEGCIMKAFCGVSIVSVYALKGLLNRYASRKGFAFPIIPFYLSNLRNLIIQTVDCSSNRWIDVGKPDTLAEARKIYGE